MCPLNSRREGKVPVIQRNKFLVILVGFVGVCAVAFAGGLGLSIVRHYSTHGVFGYSLDTPLIFVALVVLFYVVSMARAFFIRARRDRVEKELR